MHFLLAADDAGGIAAMAGMCVFLVIYLAVIVVIVAGMWKMFTKAGKPGWASIIPIYNTIVLLDIVHKPLWWIILLLIPFVNIVVGIILWMAIAEAVGKPNWWGILIIVPLVGLIVPGYLAFAE